MERMDRPRPRSEGPRPAAPTAGRTRLRILFVDYTVGFGGAVRSLARLRDGLEALEVDTWIVTSQTPGILEEWYGDGRVLTFRSLVNYRWLQQQRARRPWLARPLALLNAVATGWNYLKLRRIFKEIRPHIVHLNAGESPGEAMRAAEASELPWVVHARGFPVPAESRGRPDPYLEPTGAHFIAVSKAVGEAILQEGARPERVHVVYNPVDLAAFLSGSTGNDAPPGEEARIEELRGELGLPLDANVLGIFGRVVPWKGHEEALEAVLPLFREDPRTHLLVVGDAGGDPEGEALLQRLEAHADTRGVDAQLHLAGYRSDVEALYRICDVVLHTSVEPEPFGRTVVEAMASSRPVVASPLGGPAEIVEDGVTGFLVDPRDEELWRERVRTLLGDPELRAEMGARGREVVERRFSAERHAREVLGVYTRILRRVS